MSANPTFTAREQEMRKSINAYRSLIELQRRQVEQLRTRRPGAADAVRAEIDERLRTQEQMITALTDAIEATKLQIAALRKPAGASRKGARVSPPDVTNNNTM